jgi:hypothetical protein
VDYKPKTNATVLLDTGHTKGRLHRKDRTREGNQKIECGSCAHCIKYRNLKLAEVTM